jgi:drug/metabolite transporter (DMT)-like permease
MLFFRKYSPYFALGSGILALSLSSLFIRWANAPGTVTSFFRMTLAAIVLTPFCLRRKKESIKLDWKILLLPLLAGLFTASTYLVFLAAALVSQIVGYFSVTYALGHLPAAVVSPTMIAQPVLTALLAIPFLGEGLQPGQCLGGLTVLAGIYLVNRSHQA